MSAGPSAYRSAAFVVAGNLAGRALDFARLLVVARLLAPDDFGRFVLVLAVLGGLEMTTQPGLREALVQRRGVELRVWQAAWSFLVLRGVATGLLLFLLADPIAGLLRQPDVAPLLRVAALMPVIQSLASLSLTLAQREVNLVPLVRLTLAGQVVNTIVSVSGVAVTRSAWALVAGLLAGKLAETVGSYAVRGFRPRFLPSLRLARELFGFGSWRLASSWLWYVATQGDDLIVGRALGMGPLAVYRIAYRVANVPTTEVTDVLGSVAFPALARRHHESRERARATYRRYLLLTAGISAPMAALLVGTAEPLVDGLLGPAYAAAAGPLAVIGVAGFLRAVTATGGNFFVGSGRPAYDTAMQAARAATLVGSLLALLRYGVMGAAVASLLSLVAVVPFWLLGLHRLGASAAGAVVTVVRRLPAPLAAGLAAWGIATAVALNPAAELVAAGAGGALVWAALVRVADGPLRAELGGVYRRLPRRPALGPRRRDAAGSESEATLEGRPA